MREAGRMWGRGGRMWDDEVRCRREARCGGEEAGCGDK